jgi:peptidoglycan/LPS O-acetylase OafA/YrhL
VAILFVLIFHGAYNTHDFPYSSIPLASTVIGKLGALGVLIFFAISGYLITKKLYEETPAQSSINLRAFFIKRIFRILPPLAVYLTILIALSLMGYITLVRGDWAAPLFLSNYISGSWYTSHFWSLSVEEHFYLFWPLCILAFGWRRSFGVGIVLVIAVGIYRSLTLRQFAHPVEAARLLQHTEMRIDYIMMGCLMALSVVLYPGLERHLIRLGSSAGFLLLFVLLILSTRVVRTDMWSIQALIISLMVCGSSLANGPLPRLLLANPAIRFIVKISYSLYIWQQLFSHDYSNPSPQ